MQVRLATTASDLDDIRMMLTEYIDYIATLWPDVDRTAFADEISTLRDIYPVILLAETDGDICGCVMLRELEPGVCEARRLFVRPGCRRRGVARGLMARLTEEARALAYERMRLVTVTMFPGAVELYESLGFHRVEPFREATVEVVVFMERDLACAQ
jgi:putative acetyltransferase